MLQDDDINDSTADEIHSIDLQQESLPVFEDATVTDDNVVDPITIEEQGENDDPTKILGIPAEVLREELDKRAFDGTGKPAERDVASDGEQALYEGTADTGGDLYNEQEDEFDQSSDTSKD